MRTARGAIAAVSAASALFALAGCSAAAPITAPIAAQVPQPTSTADSIPWNEAANHAGTTQRVCGPLVDSGTSDDDVFLDLGLVYPDPARFQIVVWDIGSIDPIAYGSTVCVTGEITMYHDIPEVQLTSTDAIEVAG